MCCYYFFFHFPDIYPPLPHPFLTLLCSHLCSRQLISIATYPLHSRFWLDSNNRKDKQEIRRQDRDIKVHSHYLLPNPTLRAVVLTVATSSDSSFSQAAEALTWAQGTRLNRPLNIPIDGPLLVSPILASAWPGSTWSALDSFFTSA